MIKKKNRRKKIRFFFKRFEKSNISNKFYKYKSFQTSKSFGGLRTKGLIKKSIKDYPLISIVMPNYKSLNIKKSINSVINQNYPNIELIVVDGDSGFSTVKIFKNYDNEIDFWLSEKDQGMWHAWNKGFKLAKGDYVGVVDSSNILYPNAIATLVKYIKKFKKIDFVCGTIIKDGKKYGGFRPEDIYKQFNIIPSSVVGFYIKLKSLKKAGLLNLKYKVQADYDLLYRLIVKKKFKGISTRGKEIFGDLGRSGFSKKHSFFKLLFNELRIRFNNGQNIFILIYIFLGRSIKKFISFNK